MKKTLRIISVFVITVILLSCLCGCKEIDKLRSVHAKWRNDDYSVMELNGALYKIIPYNENCSYTNVHLYTIFGVVTRSDVPVLATAYYSSNITISKDGYYIKYNSPYEYLSFSDIHHDGNVYYCREDIYDSVIYEIENGLA